MLRQAGRSLGRVRSSLPLSFCTITLKRRLATSSEKHSRSNHLLSTFVGAGIALFGCAAYLQYQRRSELLKSSGSPSYAGPSDIVKAIDELRILFPEDGNRVSTEPQILKTYGSSDNSYHDSSPHSVVVQVYSTEDVVKVVNLARKWRIPIVPYSGATSLEGHFAGYTTGGICIDMSGMDKIINVNEQDGDLVCQAGAKWEDVNAFLEERSLPYFFPLDPGPGATIGGMVGTGCSGTNAVRYGTAKGEWFLNLTVVLASGEVIKTRSRARKSSAGFDLTRLFIGAEGTLGIVTEATLRLAPLLPTRVAMAQFPDVEHACSAVQEILRGPYGAHVQCVELLDDSMMAAINKGGTMTTKFPAEDTLFFKIQGAPEAIKATASDIRSITKSHGSRRFEFAASDQEASDLWQNRKDALFATLASQPGSRCWTTDVCVPVSKLPELVLNTKRDLKQSGITNTILGHVGDGNFHALMLFKDDKELDQVREAVHRLVHRALDLEGTCTGEHGVGIGKKEYLVQELGETTVQMMKKIKQVFDPLNIMNPGKLYPD